MNSMRESLARGAAGGAGNRRRAATAGIGAALAGLLVASCGLSQDQIKKANGIFQEGVVSLETDRQQAFVSFQRAVQLNPEHRDAHYLLGHIYALQGRLELAEHEFREVLRIDPQYSDAHNYLGQVLAQQGRLRDAIRSYREALRNPLYATPDVTWFKLGEALASQGDMRGAVQAFQDALLVSPPTVPREIIHLEVGRAYYRLGEDAKAREALRQVKTLDEEGQYTAAADEILSRLRP